MAEAVKAQGEQQACEMATAVAEAQIGQQAHEVVAAVVKTRG